MSLEEVQEVALAVPQQDIPNQAPGGQRRLPAPKC